MQTSTKYTPTYNADAFRELNAEYYNKDIYSFQFKEEESLKIDLLENNNSYSNNNIFSKKNSDKKDESSFKDKKDNNSSNEKCLFPSNLENNFASNSSLNKSKKKRKKNFDVIYPKKNDFDFNKSKNTKRIIFIKRRSRDNKDNILLKIK